MIGMYVPYHDYGKLEEIISNYNEAINSAEVGDYLIYTHRTLREWQGYDNPYKYYSDVPVVCKIVSITRSVKKLFVKKNANLEIVYPDGSTEIFTKTDDNGFPCLTGGAYYSYNRFVPKPTINAEDIMPSDAKSYSFSIISSTSAAYVKECIEEMEKEATRRNAYWEEQKLQKEIEKKEAEERARKLKQEQEIANMQAAKELDNYFKKNSD